MTDLRDDLAPLLELEATPIAALAERRRHRRARRRVIAGATGAVVAVLVGAGLVAAVGGDDDPGTVVADDPTTVSTTVPTEPALDPTTTTAAPPEELASMVVQPVTARPGEIVDLLVPGREDRGVLFTLARWDGTAWEPSTFGLTSDGQGQYDCRDCPSWVAGPGPYGVEDVGVGGFGPDRVVIPDVAPAGRYRICTGNAITELCGRVEIVGDPVVEPPRPPAVTRPERITASRSLLRPGEAFDLRFPLEDPRGLAFTLSQWDGDAWTPPVAQLHSNAAAYDEPSVHEPGATVPAVQIGGRGPDHVVLPDPAEPGWYRICFDGGCAQVRILEPLPEPAAPTTVAPTEPSTEPSTSTTAPDGPPPEAVPVELVVSPDLVFPGNEVDLWFPTQATRGIPFLLQRWDGAAWAEPSYVLYSDWGGGGTPYWEAGGSGASRLPVFLGLGPDRVVIPDVAEPGTYRVCVDVDSGPCGQLEISPLFEASPEPVVADVTLELWHCGILPTAFAGDTWIADPVPFDATNAPAGATAGIMAQQPPDPDEARYVGSDGSVVRFVRLEGEWDPPCCS